MFKVAICGIDGAGKTTAINVLKSKLLLSSNAVFVAKCPFESKSFLSQSGVGLHGDKKIVEIKRIAMAFEYVKYYYDVVSQHNSIVIFDRYSICYELLNRLDCLPDDTLRILSMIYGMIPLPDLYIFCDIHPKDALGRLIKRGNYDKDEENLDILTQLSVWYKEFFKKSTVPTIKIVSNSQIELETQMNNIADYVRRKIL